MDTVNETKPLLPVKLLLGGWEKQTVNKISPQYNMLDSNKCYGAKYKAGKSDKYH